MSELSTTHLKSRSVLKLTGTERESFLEGLLTQTVKDFSANSARYAGLLTPQGKIMSAFILFSDSDALYIDLPDEDSTSIQRRLMMYKLRADVTIEKMDDLAVVASPDILPDALISVEDPRSAALGYRSLTAHAIAQEFSSDDAAYRALRYREGVPEGSDFAVEKDFWLEGDAVRLNGVSFSKGCYVGQEITARMKYRTSVKKKIVTVSTDAPLPAIGTEIINAAGKLVGDIRAVEGATGLAFVRLERLDDTLTADGQPITLTLRQEEGSDSA